MPVQISASHREMRATVRATPVRQILCTASAPKDAYQGWEREIAALPERKRKNWKGYMKDDFAAKSLVLYDAKGIDVPGYGVVHFKQRMNEQKQAMYDSDQTWRPVLPQGWQQNIPDDLPILSVRTGDDAVMDTMTCDEQRAHMQARREANATGNHESRNHSVRVPTRAGEPVRG